MSNTKNGITVIMNKDNKTNIETEFIEPTMTVDEDGNKYWRNEDGLLHRIDGPAVEFADGDKHWYVKGVRHREDGPAIEHPNGHKEWYIDGKFHRTDGPAIERADGGKAWWVNGQLHRVDGPAIGFADGYRAWYINGKKLTEEEFITVTAALKPTI